MCKLKVLVACEESQRVCTEFRRLGHESYSCDIQKPSGGHPEWHIYGDVFEVINPRYITKNGKPCPFMTFSTMDNEYHAFPGKWDIIIAHPPCTYLSAAGAVRLFNSDHSIKDNDRYNKGLEARAFFLAILSADCEHIAVENPVSLKIYALPKYTQIIQPYYFGDAWQKKTCLWLKNLPPLTPTDMVEPKGYWIGAHGKDKAAHGMIKGFRDQKTRSKTFPGIAQAMAEQWSEYLDELLCDPNRMP